MKTSLRQAATPQHRSRPRRNNRPKTPSSGQHPRRQFLQFAACAATLPALSRSAAAQVYPTRPITMIVPVAAGSATDTIGRIIAERMRRPLGQSVIVENVSGADGSIGVGRAARARPDGYTIDVGYLGGHVLNGAFYSLRYDVLNDFAPISPLVTTSNILFARKTMPAKDLNELIAWLKANPNKASVGVQSAGLRLVAAFFQKETGTHFALVPYRGTAPAMQDLALAPDIPTFAEMGLPALSFSAWNGLFAPRGTPRDIIGRLNAAAVEALADPAVRSRLVDLGYEVFPREQQTPEALGALVKADAAKWWPIIKELGIKAE